ncbi:hypothetical protein [Aquimarina agarivorans]|uniref:hypothetical protein n=1 Tax=Aquimarina agarivorans TaxID=980584 RepID=UPI000248F2C1|nr:hypothetical protein [Aquimarina agarivorans]
MPTIENTSSTVVTRNDPNISEYLDFEKLRAEGFSHIANLSGKIWTDHNIHDPGITILEVLIYALMDLGYRTSLPFQDILASQKGNAVSDNFLSPLEILSINPVTNTDYRKLFLEIEGVRNAWITPVAQEQSLYLNKKQLNVSTGNFKIELNGLYEVVIEKDKGYADKELSKAVKKLFSEYRNLCEDLEVVKVLQSSDVGVCANIEVHQGVDTQKIYTDVLNKIRNYIAPQIHFYTLKELLDKGKGMDEIFAGRPYLQNSAGFIDTNEIEQHQKRDRIYLSDLYNEILSVAGVRKVKEISLKIENGMTKLSTWEYRISQGYAPYFSAENTCIELFDTNGKWSVDTFSVLSKSTLSEKFTQPLENLNASVASGTAKEDFNKHYSIQNDFPVVYGIGTDGLPDRTSQTRKAQAMQLKGYLLFFDQLLTNYTAQLNNISTLFSLKSEKEILESDRKSYFTDMPTDVANIDELLSFFEDESLHKGSVLAVPIVNSAEVQHTLQNLVHKTNQEFRVGNYCQEKNYDQETQVSFSSSVLRNAIINQYVNAFSNEDYDTAIYKDRRGYFFVLSVDKLADSILVGVHRSHSHTEALQQAQTVQYLGRSTKSYRLVTDTSEASLANKHFFDIVYNPVAYTSVLQTLTESKETYQTRRKQFLDHLLARFGEQFTDFSLLHYQKNTSEHGVSAKEKEIAYQSDYVNTFADLSRNRGKAFNYQKEAWNTDNVSGLEKRVSGLLGIENYKRRNLCNFEVTSSFRIVIRDYNDAILFRSNKGYQTKKELTEDAKKIILQLRNPSSYDQLERSLYGFDSKLAQHLYSSVPSVKNSVITKYTYHQQLLNFEKQVAIRSANDKITSKKNALESQAVFIENSNHQQVKIPASNGQVYRFLALEETNKYINANAFDIEIETIKTWKWHVSEQIGNKFKSCEGIFNGYEDTWDDLLKKTTLTNYLTTHDVAFQWEIAIYNGVTIIGVATYPDAQRAVTGWRQAKALGVTDKNYALVEIEGIIYLQLKNEQGHVIGRSNPLEIAFEKNELVKSCISVFKKNTIVPNYLQVSDQFGFQLLDKTGDRLLVSYCVYNTSKLAVKQLESVFTRGKLKGSYIKSGDPGNSIYQFILLDASKNFFAIPPTQFETVADRAKALTTVINYFKKNELPVKVAEEPRTYMWIISKECSVLLQSFEKFASEQKARNNADSTLVADVLTSDRKLYLQNSYQFEIVATPVQFQFIYGITNTQDNFIPLMKSAATFKTNEDAQKKYTEFANQLLEISFKTNDKGFIEVYTPKAKSPVTILINKKDETLKEIQKVTKYLNTIYTKDFQPNEKNILEKLVENNEERYEWRFCQKNQPIAISVQKHRDRDSALVFKSKICDVKPPIDLQNQPQGDEIINCPVLDSNKFHYQVSFSDAKGRTFILISYKGYANKEKALDAYKNEYLSVIALAKDPENYGKDGRISLVESYSKEMVKECNSNAILAVVPTSIKNLFTEVLHAFSTANKLEVTDTVLPVPDKGSSTDANVITYLSGLAAQYPIQKKVEILGQEKIQTFSYHATQVNFTIVPTKGTDIEISKIWESTAEFDTIEKAITAYNFFYNLAGTANHCMVTCLADQFYVSLTEVLLESSVDYGSENEAWGASEVNSTPLNGGLNAFLEAAEKDSNYIPYCDQSYWKFKVVSDDYYLVDYASSFNSRAARDQHMEDWEQKLGDLDFNKYITQKEDLEKIVGGEAFQFPAAAGLHIDQGFCEFMFLLRKGIEVSKYQAAQREETLKRYLNETLKSFPEGLNFVNALFNRTEVYDVLFDVVNRFPVFQGTQGYQYRLCMQEKNTNITPQGLMPFDTNKDDNEAQLHQNVLFPFESVNTYHSANEALQAYYQFQEIVELSSPVFTAEPIEKTAYGSYSFQIINPQKVLAYHPQIYNTLLDVEKATDRTKKNVRSMGMHLVEHLLLRPKNKDQDESDGDEKLVNSNCLLPVCPEVECKLDWQTFLSEGDPCLTSENRPVVTYIPGSDPYSFWATVVLPSWIAPFKTTAQRKVIENVLHREAPALVGLNIKWLSPRELCNFEAVYYNWLIWAKNPEKDTTICVTSSITPNCQMVALIGSLQSVNPSAEASLATASCNCNNDNVSANEVLDYVDQSIFLGNSCNANDDSGGGTREEQIEDETLINDEVSGEDSSIVPVTGDVSVSPITKDVGLTQKISERRARYQQQIAESYQGTGVRKTSSYKRVEAFVAAKATIPKYKNLMAFFIRYSLQRDNSNYNAYAFFLKQATFHLLDTLCCAPTKSISSKDTERLKDEFKALREKGISTANWFAEWNHYEIISTGKPNLVIGEIDDLLLT